MSSLETELETATQTTWNTVSQVVFPGEDNDDALALYLDFGRQVGSTADEGDDGTAASEKKMIAAGQRAPIVQQHEGSDIVTGRRSLELPGGKRVSLGAYFNAFPASYWRRWTSVRTVRLSVTVSGHADVMVYRSSARGTLSRVDTGINHEGIGTFTFDLPLNNFGDGGWYWFDLLGHGDGASLVEAEWQVEEEPVRPGTLSIGVTTLNRSDYCLNLIQNVAAADELRDVLDVLYIVDQGTKPVEDEPGWDEAAAELGSQLKVIHQANLGGSGGFARGMYETATAGVSTYHMMLDDDVQIEPASIVRALTFASYCRKPTLVGGHMFDLFNRSVLHAYGEGVDRWKWFWGPVRGMKYAHDLAKSNLRATGWMHRRTDVDYNGWWMTMVPVEVIKNIGTSLPVFIKWDDAEFGLRAAKAGYPTVTLPGACVWHMSWTDKDDTIDWQAYYHHRNRVLVALMYSPYPRGGSMLPELMATSVRHLISMQYYAQSLRNEAVRDLLTGPGHLHATIGTKLAQLRAAQADFPDAVYEPDPDAYPTPWMPKPSRKGPSPKRPRIRQLPLKVAATAVKQLKPVRPGAHDVPEIALAHMDTGMWTLSRYDSALVTKADGSGVAFYQRKPEQMRQLLRETIALHNELRRNWDRLSKEYNDALAGVTSLETWKKTFGIEDAS